GTVGWVELLRDPTSTPKALGLARARLNLRPTRHSLPQSPTMTPTTPASALVLFSGGQDSTVCLAWALERFAHVETVGFHYGQRHHAELDARLRVRARIPALWPAWQGKLGEDHLLRLDA